MQSTSPQSSRNRSAAARDWMHQFNKLAEGFAPVSGYAINMSNMRFSDISELSKPKIGVLILVTSLIGFFYAGTTPINYIALASLCLGTLFSCSGSAMLNNFLERDLDKLMERTKTRALPSGRVKPEAVLGLGLLFIMIGIAILWAGCNLLTAFFSLLTCFLYVLVYTPMKRLSTLNTIVGAFPGALPAAGGVVAATGEFDFGALILFSLLFIWQMPHFFSIAWLCREDYQKAGFRMLPSIARGDSLTCAQMIAFSILLVPISLMLSFDEFGYGLYAIAAVLAAAIMIISSVQFALAPSAVLAKRVLKASLLYFPIILLGVGAERVIAALI
jgi:protoheme IX farnesyltransferase